MDCSICMDAITKETGCTTLSCQHTFHFRCIDNWFGKQVWDDQPQTCPCCRSEGSDLDRCEVMQGDEEEEEDEDDEYEDDAESQSIDSEFPDDLADVDLRWERVGPGRWMIISAPEMALEGVRGLFGPLNELEVEAENPREVAARKIQAIFRGSQVRNTHQAAITLYRLFQQAYAN